MSQPIGKPTPPDFWGSPHPTGRGRREAGGPPAAGAATVVAIAQVAGWNVPTVWTVEMGDGSLSVVPGHPQHDELLATMREWLRTGGAPVAVTVTTGPDGSPVIGP